MAGGKTMAGPFVAVLDVSGLKAGPLPAAASVDPGTVLVQDLTLQKEWGAVAAKSGPRGR